MNLDNIMELVVTDASYSALDNSKRHQDVGAGFDEAIDDLRATIYDKYRPQEHLHAKEFGYSWMDRRWRGTIYHHQAGWTIRMRAMPSKIARFDELDFEYESVMRLVRGEGLTIFAGPTAAGKSTTLLAAMDALRNEGRLGWTITIEDPVEFLHPSPMIEQREVGVDTESFDRGVIEAMRFSPDTIVVGEIRDSASADAAVQAGQTGHRVLATVHANSTADVVNRLFARLSEPQRRLLPTALQGIMVQRLERLPKGPPVALHETLYCTDSVRAVFEKGPEGLPQLNHQFDAQKVERMSVKRARLRKAGIIP